MKHLFSTVSVASDTGFSLRHVRRLAEQHHIPHIEIHANGMHGNRLFLYTQASLDIFRRLRKESTRAHG